MIYKDSCHFGRIAFEVEGKLIQAMDCNCSICSRTESSCSSFRANNFDCSRRKKI
jgi:hypothetical protein